MAGRLFCTNQPPQSEFTFQSPLRMNPMYRLASDPVEKMFGKASEVDTLAEYVSDTVPGLETGVQAWVVQAVGLPAGNPV